MDPSKLVPRPGPSFEKAPFSLLEFLLKFRWVVIVPVVLPLSGVWSRWHSLRCYLSTRTTGPRALLQHEERVKRVCERLRARDPETDGQICSARPTYWSVTQRSMEYKKGRPYPVDLNDFVNILEIDEEKLLVRAEPYVRMAQMTAALLPRKLSMQVVPEYDDLTVGGLVCGYGIEGSSHRYGLFADTVESMDLVLADGKLVTATSTNEYKDLFYAIQWSQGTIAMLVAVNIRLVKVEDYVRLTYSPVHGTLQDIGKAWADIVAPKDKSWPAFQEGIVYNSTSAVLMSGEFASAEEAGKKGPINRMGAWYKPWFYKYAESFLSKPDNHVEYVPTRDYFHRHTQALYWECELLVPFGNHPLFRYLLGWLMPPRVSFLKLTTIGKSMWQYYQERHNAQDVLVPMRKTGDCLEASHDLFDIYPLWLNAHRIFKTNIGHMIDVEPNFEDLDQGNTADAQMYSDVGIWGVPKPILRGEKFDGAAAQSELEQFLIRNHGYQALYAVTEMSEDDFWRMFDNTLYREARKKYGAEGNFMDIYYKVHQRKDQPVAKKD